MHGRSLGETLAYAAGRQARRAAQPCVPPEGIEHPHLSAAWVEGWGRENDLDQAFREAETDEREKLGL